MPYLDKQDRNRNRRARYQADKAKAIEYLGSKCIDCGSKSELEFDHNDATTKTSPISPMFGSSSWSMILVELNKCVLRCHDCHLSKSISQGDIKTVPHGGGSSGKKNCTCELCSVKRAEYMKSYISMRNKL